MRIADLQKLAKQLVKRAATELPGGTNAQKREFAAEALYRKLEEVDDKVVLLGAWVKKVGGVKAVDNAAVDTLERWICEQIIRMAWIALEMGD